MFITMRRLPEPHKIFSCFLTFLVLFLFIIAIFCLSHIFDDKYRLAVIGDEVDFPKRLLSRCKWFSN